MRDLSLRKPAWWSLSLASTYVFSLSKMTLSMTFQARVADGSETLGGLGTGSSQHTKTVPAGTGRRKPLVRFNSHEDETAVHRGMHKARRSKKKAWQFSQGSYQS